MARAFEKLSIGYYLCGSFASGLHGLYRASADSDFVADLSRYRVPLRTVISDDTLLEGRLAPGKKMNKQKLLWVALVLAQASFAATFTDEAPAFSPSKLGLPTHR